MNDERGNWYLLTGLVLGAILGVLYARQVRPLQYIDTSPASLRREYKDSYRALIASAYLANGDLVRARARLELLKEPDMFAALSEQAQRTLAEGSNPEEARALGILAVALGNRPGAAPATTAAPPPPTGTAAPD